MEIYNDRRWLNREGSPSTGSFVAYSGPDPWKGDTTEMNFIEIADCHGKIRLHTTPMDSKEEFIEKLSIIVDSISQFIQYLKKETK